MNRRIISFILAIILTLLIPFSVSSEELDSMDNSYTDNMKRDILSVMMSYPGYIVDIEVKDNYVYLVMKSGKKIVYDDKKKKSSEEKLSNADIQDSLEQVYKLGKISEVMSKDYNPGRVRCYALLSEVYGSSKEEVEKHIKNVCGTGFTTQNNASTSLNNVFKEINSSSKSNPSIGGNVYPTAGSYNYRYVRGTGRLSAHAFGIAIDLKTNNKDYWKWVDDKQGSERIKSYPEELYDIFEKNNFIWGGKWGYFDIMHYEYRPEIIYKAKYFSSFYNNDNVDSTNCKWYNGAPDDEETKKCIELIDEKITPICKSYMIDHMVDIDNDNRCLSTSKLDQNLDKCIDENNDKSDDKIEDKVDDKEQEKLEKQKKEEEAKIEKELKQKRIEELKKEAVEFINALFIARNKAIINQDLSMVEHFYNKKTRYGLWAYEYEERKMKYIKDWGEKQGAIFTDITPQILIRKVKGDENCISINLSCSTEYNYYYEGDEENINSSRIGTYHIIQMTKKDGEWIILKEWYKDPFGDSLDTKKLKSDDIKKYILSQQPRDFSNINERRKKCVAYGLEYSGAGNEEGTGFNYNKKYRNYNSEGGDCADFASQMLYEGGGFKMNSAWNVDKMGATRAWVNADGFKDYMINSGRAYVIASGKYDKVYKASYKLLPGDFVAYEKKGDIIHISMVTGADSKGYTLVTCHNTDRRQVPWDLGFSNNNIRYYLVHVSY